jgi:hypothetical protein
LKLRQDGAGRALAALALSVSVSCGGDSPAGPAAPTPTPLPTSTPGPGIGGGGTSASCSIGKGDVNADCFAADKSARLQASVEGAIDLAVREKPQLFDLTSEERPNTDTFRVLDVEGYLDAVVTNLRRGGACSERDPDDFLSRSVLVKDVNDFSERFAVLSQRGYVQRGREAFVESCTPASFPVDRVGDVPRAGSGCARPYPPPISLYNVKVPLAGIAYYTIDSTPIVGPDAEYCRAIGFTDGRTLCPIRPEDASDRQACENWRVGNARDTGRAGPTWTNESGALCTGEASNCLNHTDLQYSVFVYRTGRVSACATNGACGSVLVER